jgi:2-aminoethylphosphonate-pyruvate transaminase
VDDDIPYLLLTPGPITTSKCVRAAMLRDWCTWDRDYKELVSELRCRLVQLASATDQYTAVLMQGSGTFCIEATVGSVIPRDGKLLVVNNGAYGKRIAQIAGHLGIDCHEIVQSETEPVDLERIDGALCEDKAVTHVALVHCETTTGMLNPAAEVGRLARRFDKTFILDAMSSFGGVPFTAEGVAAHFLISSPNKCLQGVPGFGFVIAHRDTLAESGGWARSLSLDLHDQWREMEEHGGKWRFTSPTHSVRAFVQALKELDEEGGIAARHRRYQENHRVLVSGMEKIGFRTLLRPEDRSPIITTFLYPRDPAFSFDMFYEAMKARRFVLYPGKVSQADTFRIGTIGHVFPGDMAELIESIRAVVGELGIKEF